MPYKLDRRGVSDVLRVPDSLQCGHARAAHLLVPPLDRFKRVRRRVDDELTGEVNKLTFACMIGLWRITVDGKKALRHKTMTSLSQYSLLIN